jgi:hypothetical protein
VKNEGPKDRLSLPEDFLAGLGDGLEIGRWLKQSSLLDGVRDHPGS